MTHSSDINDENFVMWFAGLCLMALAVLLVWAIAFRNPALTHADAAAKAEGEKVVRDLERCRYGKPSFLECASVVPGGNSGVTASFTRDTFTLKLDPEKDASPNVLTFHRAPSGAISFKCSGDSRGSGHSDVCD